MGRTKEGKEYLMLELKCLICEANSRETKLYTTVLTSCIQEELGLLGQQMLSHIQASHSEQLKEIIQLIPILQGFQFIKNFHCLEETEASLAAQYIAEKELMRAAILESCISDLSDTFVKESFKQLMQSTNQPIKPEGKPEVIQ